jgi:hypothetical protein
MKAAGSVMKAAGEWMKRSCTFVPGFTARAVANRVLLLYVSG